MKLYKFESRIKQINEILLDGPVNIEEFSKKQKHKRYYDRLNIIIDHSGNSSRVEEIFINIYITTI